MSRTHRRKRPSVEGMRVWEEHANVSFVVHPQDDTSTADIRISFRTASGSSWSAVGATKRSGQNIIPAKNPTINFGVLTDGTPLNEKAIILHELGHVLGMMHEHQSPARGVKITLKTEEVYKYYRPLLGFNDKLVKTQIIDQYKQGESNFSHFDPKSIMMYFMPAHLNVENIQIRPNTKLSELDKAYIQLAYPHNDSGRLLSALGTIGVPESEAMRIIEPISICAIDDKEKRDEWWKNNKGTEDTETEPKLKHFLRAVRMEFFDYNKRNIEAQALLKAKKKRAGTQEPLKESNQLTTTQAQEVESMDNSN
ncbi:hypothetical protein JVU11DRAFT_11701 [Chiua virens]|nr:hypothetical protein JVU11DRAFT_11701 [Chiua virens]